MSEYYAVQRSNNSLKHYGVRGMKWGIRKAIQKSSGVKLSRQYKKASRKLEKLNKKANLNYQSAQAKKYGKATKIAAGIGVAGLAGAAGAKYANSKNWKKFDSTTEKMWRTINNLPARKQGWMTAFTKKAQRDFVINNPKANILWGKHLDKSRKLDNAKILSGGIGALGAATAIGTGAKALAAKRRTTIGGHAAAVARRNAWKKEMQTAFKGTKYAKLPSIPTNNNRHGKKRKKA